jgi:hypothetical protein
MSLVDVNASCARLSTNTALKSTRGRVWTLIIEPSGVAGYVRLYDAASVTGTAVLDITVPAVGASLIPIAFPPGIKFNTAVYLAVSNCTVSVCYS